MSENSGTVILGGGVTGLAAGMASGFPVYEARDVPGGICASYYMGRDTTSRHSDSKSGDSVYRFEYGGGHWIFGGDATVLRIINALTPVNRYRRHSAVHFPESLLYVPYPLQNHLSYLGKDTAARAVSEIVAAHRLEPRTMAERLEQAFGRTLMDLFFAPFHELYTAGLWTKIAPQDSYKSPESLNHVIQGAFDKSPPVGYNATFIYPMEGLSALAAKMAQRCDIHYGKEVVRLDLQKRLIEFHDGSGVRYDRILSSLALNRMCEMSGLCQGIEPDPYTSVLVVNIGAVKGPTCPDFHWIYVPSSRSGFHRIGFYSNVEPGFLPQDSGLTGERVSIYVEKAYPGGQKPEQPEIACLSDKIVAELQAWGFIRTAEVVDPTWIDIAYTWSWPGSPWKQKALKALADYEIYQVGRYGRWVFEGIADSIRDGFLAGTTFRKDLIP